VIADNHLGSNSPTRIQRDADASLASDHVIIGDDESAESVNKESAAVPKACLDAYDSAFDPVVYGDLWRDFARAYPGNVSQAVDSGVDVRQFDFEHLTPSESNR